MYVCICNALTERHVHSAIRQDGATSVSGVYRCLGATPQCGKCVRSVRAMLANENARPALAAE